MLLSSFLKGSSCSKRKHGLQACQPPHLTSYSEVDLTPSVRLWDLLTHALCPLEFWNHGHLKCCVPTGRQGTASDIHIVPIPSVPVHALQSYWIQLQSTSPKIKLSKFHDSNSRALSQVWREPCWVGSLVTIHRSHTHVVDVARFSVKFNLILRTQKKWHLTHSSLWSKIHTCNKWEFVQNYINTKLEFVLPLKNDKSVLGIRFELIYTYPDSRDSVIQTDFVMFVIVLFNS